MILTTDDGWKLSNEDIRNKIIGSADEIYDYNHSKTFYRINAQRALDYVTPITDEIVITGPEILDPQKSYTFTANFFHASGKYIVGSWSWELGARLGSGLELWDSGSTTGSGSTSWICNVPSYNPNDDWVRDRNGRVLAYVIVSAADNYGVFYSDSYQVGINAPLPLSVNISGPSVLYANDPLSEAVESTDMKDNTQVSLRRPAPSATGTWTANASGGEGQYTYQWYYSSDHQDGTWYPIYGAIYKDLTREIFDDITFKCTVNSAGQTAEGTKFVRFINDIDFLTADVNTTLENYPNPFNPVTTIRFGLPEAANVKLVVYSITGAKVATLVDGYLSEGYHEARWNGLNQAGARVASGIYIYELISGEKRFIKKMLLAK